MLMLLANGFALCNSSSIETTAVVDLNLRAYSMCSNLREWSLIFHLILTLLSDGFALCKVSVIDYSLLLT